MKERVFSSTILVICLTLFLTLSATGQAPELGEQASVHPQVAGVQLELAGQTGGGIYAMDVRGKYAYVGVGLRMVILDISDSSDITVVGRTDVLPDVVRGVAVASSYAYITGGGTLHVIDVSTPGSPTFVGSCNVSQDASDLTVAGDTAFVIGSGVLHVIDVSVPGSPAVVGSYNPPGDAIRVAAAGNYAYVAAGDEGLRIVDVSTPGTPMEVGYYAPPDWHYNGVAVRGNYVYVTDPGYRVGDPSARGSLVEIDVSSPEAAISTGSHTLPGPESVPTGVIEVAGNHVVFVADYVGSCAGDDMYVADVSTPGLPGHLHYHETNSRLGEMAMGENYVLVASSEESLNALSVSTSGSLTRVGAYDTLGYAADVAVDGDYAYIADKVWAGGGLRAIDVSTPEASAVVGSYPMRIPCSYGARGVAVAGNHAYVVGDGGLSVVGVSTPGSPSFVGSCGLTWDNASRVAVAGDYAYVVEPQMSLRVVDVSTPGSPTEVGSWPGSTRDVAVAGNYAYVVGGMGLYVIDVSTPGSPVEVGFSSTPSLATGVAVVGNYAYVAAGGSGLRIINVSNPASPIEVGSLETLGNVSGVALEGKFAFVAGDELHVINISTPGSPFVVASYALGGADLAVQGGYVYVAAENRGLLILSYTVGPDVTPTPTLEPYWFNGRVYDDDTGLAIEGVTVKLYQWVDLQWTEIISQTTSDTGLYGLWAEGLPGKYAVVEVNLEGYASTRAWVHQGFNGTIINPDRVEFDHPPNGLVGMTHFYDVVVPPTITPTPTLTPIPTATPESYMMPLPLVVK